MTAFNGNARFIETTFSSDAWFVEATFSGDARFDEAAFNHKAWFVGATFSGGAWFLGATFNSGPYATDFENVLVHSSKNHRWPLGWEIHDDGDGRLAVVRVKVGPVRQERGV